MESLRPAWLHVCYVSCVWDHEGRDSHSVTTSSWCGLDNCACEAVPGEIPGGEGRKGGRLVGLVGWASVEMGHRPPAWPGLGSRGGRGCSGQRGGSCRGVEVGPRAWFWTGWPGAGREAGPSAREAAVWSVSVRGGSARGAGRSGWEWHGEQLAVLGAGRGAEEGIQARGPHGVW